MGLDPDALGRLAYLVLLLAGVSWFFLRGGRRRRGRGAGKPLRDVLIWVLIFAMVIIAYGLRDAF